VCVDSFAASLSVGDGAGTPSGPTRNETDAASGGDDVGVQKSSNQPAASLTPQTGGGRGPSPDRSNVSPTYRALQEMEAGAAAGAGSQSATRRPLRDGEEMRYHGYTNPHKQSRSFQMLEQGLRMSESGAQPGVCVCVCVDLCRVLTRCDVSFFRGHFSRKQRRF